MDDKRIIEGKWWIHGDGQPAVFGTLIFDRSSDLKLIAKNPTSRSIDEAFADAFDAATVRPVLHGEDEHGKRVSLFGCGIEKRSVSGGMETIEIGALAGLLGEQISSWDSATFRTAGMRFTLLHEWLAEQVIENTKTADDRPAVTLRPPRENWVYTLPDGERLRIDREVQTHHSSSQFAWNFSHRVWLHFAPENPLPVITTRASQFRQLLTLLVGVPVYNESFELFHTDPFEPNGGFPEVVELMRPNLGLAGAPRDIHAHQMIVPFAEIDSRFQQVLDTWFGTYQRIDPVLSLFFAVFFNKRLPVTAKFLQLVQALEAYHGRSARFSYTDDDAASQPTLAQRLKDIFSLHASEAGELFQGIPDLTQRIRNTRNYLTHSGQRRGSLVFSEAELSQVTFWLLPFLQICLLKDLGIDGAPVKRIVHRFSNVHFIDLESGEPNVAN